MKSKKKVGLVKRIAARVCAVMLAVSCIGAVPYYAAYDCYNVDIYYRGDAVSLDDVVFPSDIVNSYEHVYIGIGDDSEGEESFYLFYSNVPFVLKSEYVSEELSNAWNIDKEIVAGAFYSTDFGANWSTLKYSHSIYGMDGVNITSFPAVYGGHVLYFKGQFLDRDGNILYENDGVIPPLISESYNSSFGYLQNVTSKKMLIDGDDYGTQSKYKFSFDTISSSGIDLSTGDYVIRLYEQTSIYKNGIWQPFSCPKVYIGDYDASGGSLSFNIADAMTITDNTTGDIEGYDFLSIALNNYVRADTYWLQIYNKTTSEYGGFVEMKQNPSLQGQFITSTHYGSEDNIENGGGTDDSGYVDDIVNSNVGIGTDYENAELDADRTDLGDNGEALNELNNILSTVTAVPEAFTRMFSFLPDWCLNSIGISVVAGFAIVIWKTGRG